MYKLKAEIRNKGMKGRQLRREGLIPGVLFAKHLEESISIQIPQRDAEHFLMSNSIGYKLELVVDGKKHMALLKDVTYTPGVNKLEHLSFQAMKAGEMVTSIAHIVLLNREKVYGVVQQTLSELSYRALPSDLVEKIVLDLDGKEVGYSVTVADLDASKNEAVEILSPPESLVVSISARKVLAEEKEESEEGAQSAAQDETAAVSQ